MRTPEQTLAALDEIEARASEACFWADTDSIEDALSRRDVPDLIALVRALGRERDETRLAAARSLSDESRMKYQAALTVLRALDVTLDGSIAARDCATSDYAIDAYRLIRAEVEEQP